MAKKRHPPTDENGKKHPNRHFWQKKSACGKPPAEGNGPFPRETLFGPKKRRLRQAASQNANFICRKNGKKHQNRHEMVIHGSKWDVDHTKMIRKTRSTKPRSSYCAKTLKMKVSEGFDGREFFENFRDFWPYGYKIDMAI